MFGSGDTALNIGDMVRALFCVASGSGVKAKGSEVFFIAAAAEGESAGQAVQAAGKREVGFPATAGA